MAKLKKVHYFRIKATFDKPVSARDATFHVRNTAALAYGDEYPEFGPAESFTLRGARYVKKPEELA